MKRRTLSERTARDRESAALERLAKRIAKTAHLLVVAAAYHDDGAFDTARARIALALKELDDHRRYLALDRWHDKPWRRGIAADVAAHQQTLDDLNPSTREPQ